MSENLETTSQLRPVYFQPGQVIFHAHGNLRGQTALIDALLDWANKVAESQEITLSVPEGQYIVDFNPLQSPDPWKGTISSSRTTSSKKGEDTRGENPPGGVNNSYVSPQIKIPPAFSLVRFNAWKKGWPDHNLDSDAKEQESDEEGKLQADAFNELLNLINLLDSSRDKAPIKLEVVSPNWLMSGSSRPGGTGGPGGPPYPYEAGKQVTTEHFLKVDGLPESICKQVMDGNQGTGVAVVILDTSYTAEQLESFYHDWVVKPRTGLNPVIRDLLGDGRNGVSLGALRNTDGSLRVHTDLGADVNLDLRIDGHNYDMTDHGLFIAGLINSIAPKAEIHLYQVLNKNGLGDLFIIAHTLEKVLATNFGAKTVINLSLNMNFPIDEGCLKPNDQFQVGTALIKRKPWWLAVWVAKLFNQIFRKEYLCCCDTWFERQALSFEWICDMVYGLNSRIIAAAGNESRGKSPRLPALYPAAFDRVLGVGARAIGTATAPGAVATYSNLDDTPVSQGVWTLGGEDGPGKGILGVYMGTFPVAGSSGSTANNYGFGWWSGTSFATPIVTGIIAAMSSGSTKSIEETIFEILTTLQSPTVANTENILFVKQAITSP